MKLMKFIKYIIPLFLVQPAFSTDDVEVGKRVPAYIDESGDTIPNIWLQPVYVFPKLVFKNEKQEKFYWRTVRDVKKTLPYAKIIGGLVNECDSVMATLKTEKERTEYMKKKEDELVAIYKPIFRKMTLSQGKMMIRLVDRQCEKTSYALVKQFRGGFRAAFWQGFAKMLGADLKVSYDPNDENDRIVERVIILVEAGQL
ncbi:MAG: DUF4294 domain-containing protein [Paludibacteraceae bacterium]|nr:DUF4294 domain-containing protein [Paludibacteraceae bacterium]